MNRFLKATVLACGFAGALTLGFAGCAKQEEDASAVPAPAGLQEELKNESPDGLGRGDRNDILRRKVADVLESGMAALPEDATGIVRPVKPDRLDRGVVEAGFAENPLVAFIFLPSQELSPDSFTPVPGNEAEITREDGVLTIKGGPGFLVSERQYGDFILQAEVKCNAPDSNSGIFFRTMEPTAEAPSNGYEMQLQNTLGPGGRTDPDDYGDGFGTGGIFRRQPARYVNADDGEWFHVTLVCVGNRMATWVNGLQVTSFTDEREPDPNPRKGRRDEPGYLVLQGHDPTTDVSFRNFRIQSLDEIAAESD